MWRESEERGAEEVEVRNVLTHFVEQIIKVPLAETKEKIRSALHRATRKSGRNVATASDDEFLYVWNVRE